MCVCVCVCVCVHMHVHAREKGREEPERLDGGVVCSCSGFLLPSGITLVNSCLHIEQHRTWSTMCTFFFVETSEYKKHYIHLVLTFPGCLFPT